jgi:hypothetical protein
VSDPRLFITQKDMHSPVITIEALVQICRLNVGELEQLQEWRRRYADLLVNPEGLFYLEPALRAVEHVRRGWNPSLKVPPQPTVLQGVKWP